MQLTKNGGFMRQIVKRDGRVVDFDEEKIVNAILKAMQATKINDKSQAELLAEQVIEHLNKMDKATVEDIQDTVETVLIENGLVRTAKEFILYRAERSRIRESNTRLMKTFEDLTFKPAKDNDVKRENANINGDTAMGTMLKYGSEGAKMFYELCVLNPEHAAKHKSGDIHIHDLDFLTLTTTCCQLDLDKLFTGGFSTGNGFLREPNDISSYSSLTCIAIQSNQNDQHGGQSIPKFDYDLSKGVKKTFVRLYKDNLSKALEIETERTDTKEIVNKIHNDIVKENNEKPSLVANISYKKLEAEKLKEFFSDAEIVKAQNFTQSRSEKETDRATYQAMEALVHNLNTMHSRAGAQIPFSSINYGTDISPEGRMVSKNVMLATEA